MATVSAATADPNTANQSSTETTTVEGPPAVADLGIAQTDDPDPVSAGGVLAYTLTVTNAGPDAAEDVTVIDTLPAGVSNVAASGAGWTCGVPASGTIACMRSGLAAGSAPAIRVTLTAPASGPLTNTAEVRSSTQDPVTENNSATETTTVFAQSSGADLAIALGEIPDSVEAGQSLTYALTVTNRGPESAKGVIVTSTLPAEVKVHRVSGSGWRCARPSGVVTCKRGASGVGPLPPIMIAARAPGRGGAITISASVSSSTPDPSTDDNTLERTTPVTPVHDMAVRALTAPRSVALAGAEGTGLARVRVQIENRSPHDETIPNLERLGALVALTVRSLGACPDLQATLIEGSPQASLPRTLRPLERLNVWFEVPFTGACLNDPQRSTRSDPGHEDYTFTATVTHAALDEKADTHTVDDLCPRSATPPYIDPYPYGSTKDRGCGAPKSDRTFGGPVSTDLFFK